MTLSLGTTRYATRLLTLGLASSLLACTQPEPLATLSDSLGTQFVRQAPHKTLAIGLVCRGKTYTFTYGGTTPRTLYELASVTKTFTGILLAHALLEKRLRLTDPVRQYLGDSFANLTYQGRPVTIGDLATHTSGLPKFIPAPSPGLPIAQTVSRYATFSQAQFLDSLARVRLDAIPGTRFLYANTDAQLLGIVLERVYHTSYAQLLRRYLTGPQHMLDTQLEVAARDSSRFVPGYNEQGQRMPRLQWWRQTPAAGYLKSTVTDMVAYLRLNLNEANPAIRLAHQPHSAVPTDKGDRVGLLWFSKQVGPAPHFYHAGGSLGTSTYVEVDPAHQTGVVLLTNETDPNTERELTTLATHLLAGATSAK